MYTDVQNLQLASQTRDEREQITKSHLLHILVPLTVIMLPAVAVHEGGEGQVGLPAGAAALKQWCHLTDHVRTGLGHESKGSDPCVGILGGDLTG